MSFAQLLSNPKIATDRRYVDLMRAFEEVALRTMQESFRLDDVLLLVGRRLCELLEVTRCSVYLRQDDGLFEGRAGWSKGRDIGASIKTLVSGMDDDLFTQEIVATAAPVLVTDASKDPRTIQRTMRRWRVHDMLGVPLVVDGEVIGIIYVDNEDEPHAYTPDEISMAQAFASLAGVAVRQGWLHSELEERARVIDRQRTALQKLADTHTRLTAAVLDGADLPSLLALVQELVGKPVLFYSPALEVVAWSAPEALALRRPPALSHRATSIPWVQRTLARAQTSKKGVILPPVPEAGSPHRRFLCALSIDRRFAGLLEVVELGRPLTAFDGAVLERAATAVSLQLLSERRQAEGEGQARQDFLADLLHGNRPVEQLRRRAPVFGLDPRRPTMVIRTTYTANALEETATARRLAVEACLRDVLNEPRCLLSMGVPGAALFLVALEEHRDATEVENRLQDASALVHAAGCHHIIVSDACAQLEELPRASVELRELAQLLQAVGASPQLALARRLGLIRFAAAHNGLEEARRFADALLEPLRRSDGDRGQLLLTLQTHFALGNQVRATSRALDVHENTVRYRLHRIRELSDIDVEDADTAAHVRFALQLLELLGALSRPEVSGDPAVPVPEA